MKPRLIAIPISSRTILLIFFSIKRALQNAQSSLIAFSSYFLFPLPFQSQSPFAGSGLLVVARIEFFYHFWTFAFSPKLMEAHLSMSSSLSLPPKAVFLDLKDCPTFLLYIPMQLRLSAGSCNLKARSGRCAGFALFVRVPKRINTSGV